MKVHSPVVVSALAEALRTIYWYLDDLRSFMLRAGVPPLVVSALDWNQRKREIVRDLLDDVAPRLPDHGFALISNLLDAVVEQDSFDHLLPLEDGERKARDAAAAVSRVRDLLGSKTVVERAERARAEARTEAEAASQSPLIV